MTDMPRHAQQMKGKLLLRKYFLDKMKEYNCLYDFFCGSGSCFFKLYSLYPFKKYVLVDSDKEKVDFLLKRGINAICSDNREIIKKTEFEENSFIDLDSYGIPAEQLDLVIPKLKKGDVLVITCGLYRGIVTLPKRWGGKPVTASQLLDFLIEKKTEEINSFVKVREFNYFFSSRAIYFGWLL